MRTDAIAPRTWVLATVAGWAVLVWLLALFGLGGRIAPRAADPSLAANLPQPRMAAASRVGVRVRSSSKGRARAMRRRPSTTY